MNLAKHVGLGVFLLLAGAVPATAATITFGGAGQGQLNTYSEAGFTIARTSGDVSTGAGSGNPAPSLFGFDGGTFQVTGAGLFTFGGFDGGSGALSSQTQTFNVVGLLGGVSLFNTTYTRNGAFGFQTFASNSAASIDRLVFNLSSTNGTSYNVDNIVVNGIAAAVPEPATWAMMLVGFGLAGSAMRRRKTIGRISYAA